MTRLLISFATRPGAGSEGGVGWEFLKAHALACTAAGEEAHVLIDSRDESSVRESLSTVQVNSLHLHCHALPRWSHSIFGPRKTRLSYLSWLSGARTTVGALDQRYQFRTVHQVTFATASMPHAMNGHAARVWGPLAVPSRAVETHRGKKSISEVMGLTGARLGAPITCRDVQFVVTQNQLTHDFLADKGRPTQSVTVEPNIVAEPREPDSERQRDTLIMVGRLIDRKRPWLALMALKQRRLRDFRLLVVGDGPLRPHLLSYVNQEGLARRVSFTGILDRDSVLTRMAQSRTLVHPAIREGAGWVIGEAACMGVPAVAFAGSGADSAVVLSDNGGILCQEFPETGMTVGSLAKGIEIVAATEEPAPSSRWTAARLPSLLSSWWSQAESLHANGFAAQVRAS